MCQTLYGQKHKATYTHRSCLGIESHTMKLPAHSLCADVNARGVLELYSYRFNRVLVTFRHYALRCNFSWSASSLVSCCGFLMLQLCTLFLGLDIFQLTSTYFSLTQNMLMKHIFVQVCSAFKIPETKNLLLTCNCVCKICNILYCLNSLVCCCYCLGTTVTHIIP